MKKDIKRQNPSRGKIICGEPKLAVNGYFPLENLKEDFKRRLK